MGYYGSWVLSFAWDLGVTFLGVPNLVICEFFLNIVFNLGLKDVIKRCVGCFLVYLFL